jgi:hypothetical protein
MPTRAGGTRDGELLLLWSFPFVLVTWLIGALMFPGFTGPMSPTLTADQVAAFYRDPDNLSKIRWSMILFNWFSYGVIPVLTLVVVQIKRMAHRSAIFSYCFLGCLCGAPVVFFAADLFWLLAAFRPERSPELTQLLNDMAWLAFAAQVGFLIAQSLILAASIYFDDQPRKIFPSWFAHFNIVIALALAPAAFSGVAGLTGPLAWDGLFPFWIKNAALLLWIGVTAYVVASAIFLQRREEGMAQ